MSSINYDFCLYQTEQNQEIIQLFQETFSDSEGKEEGEVIGALVRDLLNLTPKEDLKVFLAQKDNKLISAIIFTPLRFATGEICFLLSPVATLTKYQGQGIAQQLIKAGLSALKTLNTELVFTYGDPNFYSKVGFQQVSAEDFIPPHALSFPHGWLAQSLNDKPLTAVAAKSICAKGLDNSTFW